MQVNLSKIFPQKFIITFFYLLYIFFYIFKGVLIYIVIIMNTILAFYVFNILIFKIMINISYGSTILVKFLIILKFSFAKYIILLIKGNNSTSLSNSYTSYFYFVTHELARIFRSVI